jgi:hypothetical protein
MSSVDNMNLPSIPCVRKGKTLCKRRSLFYAFISSTRPLFLLLLSHRKHNKRRDKSKPNVDGVLDTTLCTNEIFLRNYKPILYILRKLQDKIISKRLILTLTMGGFHVTPGGTLTRHDIPDQV